MKKLLFVFLPLFVLTLIRCEKDESSTASTRIEAPSADAFQAAINDAPEGATIILAAGIHTLSGGIEIDKKVKLLGEDGAVLVVNTRFSTVNPNTLQNNPIEIGLDVHDAPGFCLENIEIRSASTTESGGSALYLQRCPNAVVRNCLITGFQLSILLEESDRTLIEDTKIFCTPFYNLAGNPFIENTVAHGILQINGEYVHITGCDIEGGFFGAWICDGNGEFDDNDVNNNHIGVIPCAVPDSTVTTPRESGNFLYAMQTATKWNIHHNRIKNNLLIGILMYDGSNNCTVEYNDCTDNGAFNPYGRVDIELGAGWGPGQSGLGVPFPLSVSKNNKVTVGAYPGVLVRDCGEDNTIDLSGVGIELPKGTGCF